jgi:hypothetical protein
MDFKADNDLPFAGIPLDAVFSVSQNLSPLLSHSGSSGINERTLCSTPNT